MNQRLRRSPPDVVYTPIDVTSLTKYFTHSDGSYKVIESIKRRVQFKQHDLLSDSFESGFDLVVCRNVVIYFTDEAKYRLNWGFYHSLKEYGVLFIGGTETMLDSRYPKLKRVYSSFYQKAAVETRERTQTKSASATARA